MSDNHLIIGLGGTGGLTIRAFREHAMKYLGSPDVFESHGLGVRFLYIDSSRTDTDNAKGWDYFGKSIALTNTSVCFTGGQQIGPVLHNPTAFPHITPWIGNIEQWRTALGEKDDALTATVGGQMRRAGRFLFAFKTGDILEMVNHHVGSLEMDRMSGVNFHICCGLAGGTGSGSVLDCCATLRKKYGDKDEYPIRLYAYLPEENPSKERNPTGDYVANGYAALAELDALNVGDYKPHDLIAANGTRLNLPIAFNGCCVYSDKTGTNRTFNVQDLPAFVGDYLFHKIVARTNVDVEMKGTLDRIETTENRGGHQSEGDSVTSRRCKRYFTFGMKRIEVPVSEIQEYFSYGLAYRSTLQSLYNYWKDNDGWCEADDGRPTFDSSGYVKKQLEKWSLDDAHLMLSGPVGFVEGFAGKSQGWKSLSDEWGSMEGEFREGAKQSTDWRTWITRLEESYANRFTRTFRQNGVDQFYRLHDTYVSKYASWLVKQVESDLWDDWKSGTLGLIDLKEVVTALDNELKFQKERFTAIVNAATSARAKAEEDIKRNRDDYGQIGWVSKVAFGKAKRVVDAQSGRLRESYQKQTELRAAQFAEKLRGAVQVSVSEILKTAIDKAFNELNKAAAEIKTKQSTRCTDKGNGETSGHVSRYYPAGDVRQSARMLDSNKTIQGDWAQTIRSEITKLAPKQAFQGGLDQIKSEQILSEVVASSYRQVSTPTFANNLSGTSGLKIPLAGASILDELYKLGTGLPAEVARWFSESEVLLQENGVEVQAQGPGKPNTQAERVVSDLTIVLLPQGGPDGMLEDLQRQFGLQQASVRFADAGPKLRHQITIMRMKACFPLRYSSRLGRLKEAYARQAVTEAKRFILHLEGDGSHMGKLYTPDDSDRVKRVREALLLAAGLGVIEGPNAEGYLEVVYRVKVGEMLEKQADRSFEIGQSLRGSVAANYMDWGKLGILEAIIDERLPVPPNQRDGVKNLLAQKCREICPMENDPELGAWQESRNRAMSRVSDPRR